MLSPIPNFSPTFLQFISESQKIKSNNFVCAEQIKFIAPETGEQQTWNSDFTQSMLKADCSKEEKNIKLSQTIFSSREKKWESFFFLVVVLEKPVTISFSFELGNFARHSYIIIFLPVFHNSFELRKNQEMFLLFCLKF